MNGVLRFLICFILILSITTAAVDYRVSADTYASQNRLETEGSQGFYAPLFPDEENGMETLSDSGDVNNAYGVNGSGSAYVTDNVYKNLTLTHVIYTSETVRVTRQGGLITIIEVNAGQDSVGVVQSGDYFSRLYNLFISL